MVIYQPKLCIIECHNLMPINNGQQIMTLHYTQLWLVYNHEKLTLGILKPNTLVQN